MKQADGVGRIEKIRAKRKNHAMSERGLPLGFVAALSQDKRAMQTFAQMGDRERSAVLSRARQAKTRADMRLIVASLTVDVSANETH